MPEPPNTAAWRLLPAPPLQPHKDVLSGQRGASRKAAVRMCLCARALARAYMGGHDIPEQPRPENREAVRRDADPIEAGGRAPAPQPATVPRPPAWEDDGPASGGEAAGEGSQYLRSRSKQPLNSAPHQVHEQSGARAGLGGCGQGGGLARTAAVALGLKNGDYLPPVFEQDVPRCPSLRSS